ncbi:sporulation inhibitor of replication protein SirA [Evansella cellulosilytica]|uniref:Sporulation inhibitor of replication protein SirA n=1 Tax=Evansella cellulosilytica (strain ATCC 21833 / DSM 2522 / FERM P-1141 / JCM 9156 / N-4) TaxID=649639 RepID=E6TRZ8_EVAC2|nr:sporulation inhibitor of replication protein SirA [Evansella cellulosilytica]ADU30652.1 Protein of unknown function DUF2522 [Evansella cellulosilytica DSM 2522]
MREYDIYIIKDHIANEYFGLEGKLFSLFQENRYANGRLKEVTDMQIHFIKESINISKLDQLLYSRLHEKKGYAKEGNNHFIRLLNKKSQAGVYLDEHHITLFSEGTYDAEACFFEVLRHSNKCFIAMEFEEQRYGWLKPVRTLDLVEYSI